MPDKLIVLNATTHFYAALIIKRGVVTRAAPILVKGYKMMGWTEDRVMKYAAKKGWEVTKIDIEEC